MIADADIPSFDAFTGLSPFNEVYRERLNAIAEIVVRLARMERGIVRKVAEPRRALVFPQDPGNSAFIARIDSFMLVGANRWEYDFVEMVQDSTNHGYSVLRDGRTGKALNGCEAANDGTGTESVGVETVTNNATLQMLPIRPGNVVVMCEAFDIGPDAESTTAYSFSLPNAYLLTCLAKPPPPPDGGPTVIITEPPTVRRAPPNTAF